MSCGSNGTSPPIRMGWKVRSWDQGSPGACVTYNKKTKLRNWDQLFGCSIFFSLKIYIYKMTCFGMANPEWKS
jgi:hypothetical protein